MSGIRITLLALVCLLAAGFLSDLLLGERAREGLRERARLAEVQADSALVAYRASQADLEVERQAYDSLVSASAYLLDQSNARAQVAEARRTSAERRLAGMPEIAPDDDPRLHVQAEIIADLQVELEEAGERERVLTVQLSAVESMLAQASARASVADQTVRTLEVSLAETQQALHIALQPRSNWSLPQVTGTAAKVGAGLLLGLALAR